MITTLEVIEGPVDSPGVGGEFEIGDNFRSD